MKIVRDRTYAWYTKDNRLLGNCFTIMDGDKEYHYEFEVNHDEARIKYDSMLHIKDAVKEFRKYNKHVVRFFNQDRSFYLGFDPVFIFKLPIEILQPSQFFIDQDKMKAIEENLANEDFVLPVAILDDEYVLLDGHARARYLYENDVKMVSVYMDEATSLVSNCVYIAKENNLFKIKQLEILSHEDYLEYLSQTGMEDN